MQLNKPGVHQRSKTGIGILASDPMHKAGKKMFRSHFLRMLSHESGTRLGDDLEELHDMRVAANRMRTSIRVFGKYYKKKAVISLKKGLQRIRRALGPVRDLDVMLEHLAGRVSDQGEEESDRPNSLHNHLKMKRDVARKIMLEYLDSGKYARFVNRMENFTTIPEKSVKSSCLDDKAEIVEITVTDLVNKRYQRISSFESKIRSPNIETLHSLRIEFKRLRYTLEFFRAVLPDNFKGEISRIKKIQDHLGELNDANVAVVKLQALIDAGLESQLSPTAYLSTLKYLAERQSDRDNLINYLPPNFLQVLYL